MTPIKTCYLILSNKTPMWVCDSLERAKADCARMKNLAFPSDSNWTYKELSFFSDNKKIVHNCITTAPSRKKLRITFRFLFCTFVVSK